MFNNKKLTFLKKVKNMNKHVTEELQRIGKATKYFNDGSKLIIKDEIINKNNGDYLDLLSQIYDNNLKNEKFEILLIFIIKEKKEYITLDISKDGLTKYKKTKDYLKVLKKILNLENPIDNEIEKR